jgi:hypothetical protein
MIRRSLILRAFIPTIAAAALAASPASAMDARDAGRCAARHATTTGPTVLPAARVDAAAHAATIRGIGARLLAK